MIGTILIVVGVGVIMLGVGLFVGKIMSGPSENDNGFIANIKDKLAEKKAEKQYRKEIERQARADALQSLRPEMAKKIREQELKKMTGEDKKEKMQKFADAFSMGGQGGLGSEAKINQLLGKEPQQQAQPQQAQPQYQQHQQAQPQQGYQQNQPYGYVQQGPSTGQPPQPRHVSNEQMVGRVQDRQDPQMFQQQPTPQQDPSQYLGMGNGNNDDPFSSNKINQMLGGMGGGQNQQSQQPQKPAKRGRPKKQQPQQKQETEEERILNFFK